MIKLAEQSPRIEDGIIKWYAGDTFELNFEFEFSDTEGNVISSEETDYLEFKIFNEYYDTIYEEVVYKSHEVSVYMNDENTAKFPRGKYFYVIKRNDGFITTIIQENEIVVE